MTEEDLIKLAKARGEVFKRDYARNAELLFSVEAQGDLDYMRRLEVSVAKGEEAYNALNIFEEETTAITAAKFLYALNLKDDNSRETAEIILKGDAQACEYLLSLIKQFAGADVILYKKIKNLSGIYKVIDEDGKEGVCKAIILPTTAGYMPLSDKEFLDDVRCEAFRSGGKGGQNVNKVSSCVRATHEPTGIAVVCREERSQLENKRTALERLRSQVEEYNRSRAEDLPKKLKKEIENTLKSGAIRASFNTVTDTADKLCFITSQTLS
ncbi:MAG: peptide chain release factor-like protein [Christensenellaceae bacterium]|jgi:hypothetical protein|nr:peptide chain release factor-like protein [Christensenellaceae bacterium]